MVVVGNWTGNQAAKTRPLRRLLRFVPYIDEIAQYWTPMQKRLGAGSMGSALEMPWQIDPSTSYWDRSSRLFLIFDNPTDVDVEGQKVVKSDTIPAWMGLEIARYANSSAAYNELEERWKTTTPRKMANWVSIASNGGQLDCTDRCLRATASICFWLCALSKRSSRRQASSWKR